MLGLPTSPAGKRGYSSRPPLDLHAALRPINMRKSLLLAVLALALPASESAAQTQQGSAIVRVESMLAITLDLTLIDFGTETAVG